MFTPIIGAIGALAAVAGGLIANLSPHDAAKAPRYELLGGALLVGGLATLGAALTLAYE